MRGKLIPYAPLFLRLGLAIVFFMFGFQKLSSPEQTRAEIQLLLNLNLGTAAALNYYLGIFEITISLGFLLGIGIRFLAPLASFFLIVFLISFIGIGLAKGTVIDPTLFRDFGLLGATIALWLLGPGPFSIEEMRKKKRA